MLSIKQNLLIILLISGLVFASDAGTDGINYSNPQETACGGTGLEVLICEIMKGLLRLGPFIAVIALVLAGVIYVYANMFVTADQRGRYHTLATGLAVGALILAAIVGAAGLIVQTGEGFLTSSS